MSNRIRSGVAREIIIDGYEYEPAEGAKLTYRLSGRSGPVHIAGNGVTYKESNPVVGHFSQDVSADAAAYKRLKELETSGRFVPVTITTAGNDILDGEMSVSTDGGLDNDDGTVSLEMGGNLDVR